MLSVNPFPRCIPVLALFIISISAAPPPFQNLSTGLTSRIAVYEDINAQFKLVYSVSDACPQTVNFGAPTVDSRQVAVLSLSSINEDGVLCTGPSPLNFVGEENVLRDDDLLAQLQLSGMREALESNPNAKQLIIDDGSPSLLLGWHDGERKCNTNVYPQDTIYFIINENNGKQISLKKPTQRDVVSVPQSMRALLIVTTSGKICLLADTSSNANEDVTVTVIPDDGSSPTTTPARPAGAPPAASPSTAPAAPGTVPTPVASTAAPPATSPAASQPASSAAGGGVVPVPGAVAGSTPTASPVSPVGSPSAAPVVSLAPSTSPGSVGAVLPASPGVQEVNPSFEEELIVEDTSPPESEDDGSACFPSTSTVLVERKGVKTMGELEVGDRVLTESGFSDVILFTHRERYSRNTFIRVTVADGSSLTVSPGHYVYSNGRQLTAALRLQENDVLYKSNGNQVVITNIEKVSSVGLFNPQTMSGSIVVNGLLASTYTMTVDPFIAHSVLMSPIRWVFRTSPRLAGMISEAFNNGSPVLASYLPKGASVIG